MPLAAFLFSTDGFLLQHASAELREDPELILAARKHDVFAHVQPIWQDASAGRFRGWTPARPDSSDVPPVEEPQEPPASRAKHGSRSAAAAAGAADSRAATKTTSMQSPREGYLNRGMPSPRDGMKPSVVPPLHPEGKAKLSDVLFGEQAPSWGGGGGGGGSREIV